MVVLKEVLKETASRTPWSSTGAQRRPELATGRAAPTPDVVFLVFDGENLSNMTDRNAALLLKPYAEFMGKVRTALKKPAPAVPDRGDQDGQGPGSGHQSHETKGRTAHLRGLARR